MAVYTPPMTWATGNAITADQLNQQVRDNMTAVRQVLAIARRAANQSLNDSAWTAIILDAEDEDNENYIDIGAHPTRITFPRAGHYLIKVMISYAANATGVRGIELRKDGGGSAESGAQVIVPSFATLANPVHLTYITTSVAATAYYEIYGYQSSTGALNATARVAVTLMRDETA